MLRVSFNHLQCRIAQKEGPLALHPHAASPAGFTVGIARSERAQDFGARTEDFLGAREPDATDEQDVSIQRDHYKRSMSTYGNRLF
jgi:hypothetical protein